MKTVVTGAAGFISGQRHQDGLAPGPGVGARRAGGADQHRQGADPRLQLWLTRLLRHAAGERPPGDHAEGHPRFPGGLRRDRGEGHPAGVGRREHHLARLRGHHPARHGLGLSMACGTNGFVPNKRKLEEIQPHMTGCGSTSPPARGSATPRSWASRSTGSTGPAGTSGTWWRSGSAAGWPSPSACRWCRCRKTPTGFRRWPGPAGRRAPWATAGWAAAGRRATQGAVPGGNGGTRKPRGGAPLAWIAHIVR